MEKIQKESKLKKTSKKIQNRTRNSKKGAAMKDKKIKMGKAMKETLKMKKNKKKSKRRLSQKRKRDEI
jgi:hypothetical protein